MAYTTLPAEAEIKKTIESLKARNIEAILVENGDAARSKVLELIPEGSQVMTMISVTLETLGITQVINESKKYDSVKNTLSTMEKGREKRALGAAPDFAVGSVHAVTEDGEVLVASNSGSQMAAYVYGAEKVIWVVGTHKIVKNLDEGYSRIYDHVLPQESERVQKAHGTSHSNVSKLLIFNKEITKDRITLIFVPETLGF